MVTLDGGSRRWFVPISSPTMTDSWVIYKLTIVFRSIKKQTLLPLFHFKIPYVNPSYSLHIPFAWFKNNNMRGDPRVCTENERSNYLYHPPAPRNTTSFLVRARKNGGIAFDTPPDYTAIATPVT